MRVRVSMGACVTLLTQHAKRIRCTVFYCHLWPLWLHHIFRYYLKNDMIFGKQLLKTFVFIFCTTFNWNISHFKNSARYCHKCENIFMQSIHYSCEISMKREFSRQIFGKTSRIKCRQNSPMGTKWFHADERTDSFDEANSHFSQCFQRA